MVSTAVVSVPEISCAACKAAIEGALVVAVISFVAHLVIPDDGDRR